VLISPAWKRDEVDHALALTDPAHAVGDHPVLAGLMPMLHLDDPVIPAEPIPRTPAPQADAVLVFSSGTTGMPKAVRHTHASLDEAVRHWRSALEMTERDRIQVATRRRTSSVCSILLRRCGPARGCACTPVQYRPDAASH